MNDNIDTNDLREVLGSFSSGTFEEFLLDSGSFEGDKYDVLEEDELPVPNCSYVGSGSSSSISSDGIDGRS